MITAVIVHDFTENLELSRAYPPAGIELVLEIFIPILNPTLKLIGHRSPVDERNIQMRLKLVRNG